MRVAVAGGTGWIGRHVVRRLRASGAEPLVLARSSGVDLTTGSGLDSALAGVDVVIDVSNVQTTSARKSVQFFGTATTNLLAAGRRQGVGHHLALSVVGCDVIDFGYYQGKRMQEQLVLRSEIGTVLRSTQFHEFAAQMLDRKGPLVLAPKMLCQPVAMVEVGDHLVELARGQPSGLAPELAGPDEQLRMPDMVKRLAHVRHARRPVITVGFRGEVGRQLAGGRLLPTGPGPRGSMSFSAWLEGQAATPGG